MKKFIAEFKEFIARGNVMTMAIGIIIGGAFTSIVNSLVNDVITPVIGIIIGGIDFSAVIIGFGSAQIMVGNFIQSVITFLLTALVIFVMMKLFNRFTRKKEETADQPPSEPAPSKEELLLAERTEIDKPGVHGSGFCSISSYIYLAAAFFAVSHRAANPASS